MTNKKIYGIYLLVFLFSVGLFGYWLFPHDKIKQHLIVRFEKQYPAASLDMREVRPVLPAGIKLLNPRIGINGEEAGQDFTAEKVTIGYRLFSLFGSHNAYAVKAAAYNGNITGTINVAKKNPGHIKAQTHLSDIQMDSIKVFSDMTNGDFYGLLNGDISYDSSKPKDQGILKLTLAECKVPVKISFLNLGDLEFKQIQMDASLTGRDLAIDRCTLKGLQIDGEISGNIRLSPVMEQSRINLSGTLKPHPDFVKTLPQNILPESLIGRNGIHFRVVGTFERPNFSLQ